MKREENPPRSLHELGFFGWPPSRSAIARESVKRFLTRRLTGGLHAPSSFAGAVGLEPTTVLVNRFAVYVGFSGWGAQVALRPGRKPKVKEHQCSIISQ